MFFFRWGNGRNGTQNIYWTKLNPQKLVSDMRPKFAEYPGVPGLDSFDEFMKMVSSKQRNHKNLLGWPAGLLGISGLLVTRC